MISAIFIVKNEAENITACLQAAAQVADEMIVVDHGSEDNTVELCEAAGAKVFTKEWTGYADGKNFGNNKANGNWILSLDADEILSDNLIASIKALDLTDANKVYGFDRANYFGDKWVRFCGWYPDWKVRLFNKEIGYWEGDYVHERLRFKEEIIGEKLKGKLFHYSYSDAADHWRRIEKYAQLGAEKLIANGKHPSWLKQKLSPFFRFFRTYILKLGFLDGRLGWQISKRNAAMINLKYAIYNRLRKNADS